MKQAKASVLALLLIGMAMPAMAYHIDNAVPLGTPPGLAANDFQVGAPGLIACELEWGTGYNNGTTGQLVAADDRIGTGVDTQPFPGLGGLCTSGRNDASGESAPLAMPAAGDFTRFDLCNQTTHARNGGYGPYVGSGNACSGTNDGYAYTARLGPFQCFIPTTNSRTVVIDGLDTRVWLATQDYAFYYSEQLAWWTYDGDGVYTAADGNNVAHTGDGAGEPAIPGSDNVDAWHGHVAAFLELSQSDPNVAVTGAQGSAETTAVAAPFAVPVLGTPIGEYPSDCDGSPGLDATGNPQGPVFRAPY